MVTAKQQNAIAAPVHSSSLAEHQPPVVLDPFARRALIRRTYTSNFCSTLLHVTTYTRNPLQKDDVLLSKSQTPDLRRFRSSHHPALGRWMNLINRPEEIMCRLCDIKEES